MAGLANYLADKINNNLFQGTAYTFPTTVYVALCTSAPTDSSTGSTIVEPSGNSYARVAVACNSTNFNASAGGQVTNKVAVSFPQSSGSWGTATHAAILDAASGGNLLGFGALTSSVTINASTTYTIPVGDLSWNLQ